jgi:urocanate hydratase
MEVAMSYNRENANGDQITIPFQADEKQVVKAVEALFVEQPKNDGNEGK